MEPDPYEETMAADEMLADLAAIDPSMLSPAAAQEACFGLLEAYLGPLPRTTGATG
jgi:hypothetical protein